MEVSAEINNVNPCREYDLSSFRSHTYEPTDQTATSPHLSYWLEVAEERPDIAATALQNYERVQLLHNKVQSRQATLKEAIELGYSYGALNTMEGGSRDLYDLFVCVASECNRVAHPSIYQEADSQQAAHRLLSAHAIDTFNNTPELFEAAQFLQEASELEEVGLDPDTQELLRWGAADIYEYIIEDSDNNWQESYQRRAFLHWHSVMTSFIATDLAKESFTVERKQDLLDCFAEVQIQFIERLLQEIEPQTTVYGKSNQEPREGFLVRNGELNEFFAQARGWFLIYAEDRFDQLAIMPTFKRLDRPKDNVCGKTKKFAHDARHVYREENVESMIQLKACSEAQPWESRYDTSVQVVRIKDMDPQDFRKKCRKNLRRIKSEYRSHKPRQINSLIRDMKEFYEGEL